MPWFWTDDLARLLVDAGAAEAAQVEAWMTSPVAVRRDGGDALEVARDLAAERAATMVA